MSPPAQVEPDARCRRKWWDPPEMLSRVNLPWQLALTFHVPAFWRPFTVIVMCSLRVPSVRAPFHVPVSGPWVARGVVAELAVAVKAASTATATRRRYT
jgi:hypothetical protein